MNHHRSSLWTPRQARVSESPPLYAVPEMGESRWATPENPGAEKGRGGRTNRGAKGCPFARIEAGGTLTLLDIEGSGMVTRLWLTLSELDPVSLRSIRIDMYWDHADMPAVSAPLGDFFGGIHGDRRAFENHFFANPEGKSFNCFVPMPYRTRARILLTNDTQQVVRLITYEVNLVTGVEHGDDTLYFHAHWRRERWTKLARDFEILPRVRGRGRYLGAHIGIIQKAGNLGWWGEGEVKIFLDGDDGFPTLVGTGTEDYIGTGWGLTGFSQRYQGGYVSDAGRIALYRYHVVDPVFFREDCRVTLQQLGNIYRDRLPDLPEEARVKPVALVSWKEGLRYSGLLESAPERTLADPPVDEEGVIHYREDDVCALALFYLDHAQSALPPLVDVKARTAGLTAATTTDLQL